MKMSVCPSMYPWSKSKRPKWYLTPWYFGKRFPRQIIFQMLSLVSRKLTIKILLNINSSSCTLWWWVEYLFLCVLEMESLDMAHPGLELIRHAANADPGLYCPAPLFPCCWDCHCDQSTTPSRSHLKENGQGVRLLHFRAPSFPVKRIW